METALPVCMTCSAERGGDRPANLYTHDPKM